MWYIKLEGNDYNYEINELLKLFIPSKELIFIDKKALENNQGFLLVCGVKKEGNTCTIWTTLYSDDEILDKISLKIDIRNNSEIAERKVLKRKLKKCIYEVLSHHFKKEKPWGILTGIRPTKIVHELLDRQMDMASIKNTLSHEYKINGDKIDLMLNIAQRERPFLIKNNPQRVSVYISIPFCPTKCLYCSFPSNSLNKHNRDIVSKYLEALLYEIEYILSKLRNNNYIIDSLYIGGGTPTTLDAEELNLLLLHINRFYPLENIEEITVEAGRPDTISKEKLLTLKKNKVERISINPQTMNPGTLRAIGRDHSPEEIVESLGLAREIGFKSINMDLILGLPLETPSMVEKTMEIIERFAPENLTVHTLAVKNSSRLKSQRHIYKLPSEDDVKKMLEISGQYTNKMGLRPYYMYRQKYMLGNLENIGYALPGHECIYNIQIMEERQSIIGLGAGSSSKFYFQKGNRIQRVANVTDISHYIKRVDEMVQRKIDYLVESNIDNI